MTDLARQLALVAGDLDSKGYPFAAVVRRGARALRDVDRRGDSDGRPSCGRCGDPFKPNRRGRPRKFCRTCSPPKKTEKGTV